MSIGAILVSARNIVREELDLGDDFCQCRIGPEPPAWCGQYFFALWASNWSPGLAQPEMYDALDELFEFSVTLSYRVAYVPDDRHAEEIYLRAVTGMEQYLRSVNRGITQRRYDLIENANSVSSEDYGIIEPPIWAGTDAQPTIVGPEWFSADPATSDDQGLGMHMTSKFGSIRRYQPTASIR